MPPKIQDEQDQINKADLFPELIEATDIFPHINDEIEDISTMEVIEEYVVDSIGVLIETSQNIINTETYCRKDIKEGSFCIIKEEGSLFPGRIQKVNNLDVAVSTMQKNYLGGWSWPSKIKICQIKIGDIVSIIKHCQIQRKGGNIYIEDDILSNE